MKITQRILVNNPCYKAGKRIRVSGLMLHSVGCPQPSAETFIKKWNNPQSGSACVHAFIDGNTGMVYQTLPWDHQGWHCGGSGNNTHIGVEMCEPSCIRYTGGATFNCSDRETAKAVVKRTYDSAVELFAFLCKMYGLNPLKDGVIISHKEGHDRKIASGHADPDHLWRQLGIGYTMDGFRRAVAEAMNYNIKKEKKEPKKTIEVQVGDKVALAANAVYYDGKVMPAWIMDDVWIVKSIYGDRVVIDKNISGTKSICSPVHIKYLIKK